MKHLRVLILCLLAVGLPLQGWATLSQAFCRMAQMGLSVQAAAHPVAHHDAHRAHAAPVDHLTHLGADPAMPHAMAHSWVPSSDITVDAPTLGDAQHQCGHCAQCVAAHAMASVPVLAMHWPKTQPVWVGAVPTLRGRVFTSTPERPPRNLTA